MGILQLQPALALVACGALFLTGCPELLGRQTKDPVVNKEDKPATQPNSAPAARTDDKGKLPSKEGDKTAITLERLLTTKEGFEKARQIQGRRITLSQFARQIRAAKEFADKIGGLEALAQCAEVLDELKDGRSEKKSGDRQAITAEQLLTVKKEFARIWLPQALTLGAFADMMRVVKVYADKVGDLETLAQCAEALDKLFDEDSKELKLASDKVEVKAGETAEVEVVRGTIKEVTVEANKLKVTARSEDGKVIIDATELRRVQKYGAKYGATVTVKGIRGEATIEVTVKY